MTLSGGTGHPSGKHARPCLIRQLDETCRYTERMAAGLADGRASCNHTVLEMLRQRLYGILTDYEDCNDHDTLRDDPIFRVLAGRLVPAY